MIGKSHTTTSLSIEDISPETLDFAFGLAKLMATLEKKGYSIIKTADLKKLVATATDIKNAEEELSDAEIKVDDLKFPLIIHDQTFKNKKALAEHLQINPATINVYRKRTGHSLEQMYDHFIEKKINKKPNSLNH